MGLGSEEHRLVSKDGYVLKMHRVVVNRQERDSPPRRPPVLIVHGFLCSSETWLFRSRTTNLATALADHGYDVWLANRRGNTYSHEHINLSSEPNNFKYWNFSFHESGVYDHPAEIDYILGKTGSDGVIYIGHSVGTAELLVMNSKRPEYNKKVKLAILLAPVVFPERATHSPILAFIIQQASTIARYLYRKQVYEFMPQDKLIMRLIQERCSPEREQRLCMMFLRLLIFSNTSSWDKKEFPYILSHFTYGSSVKTFLHIAQLLHQNSRFQQFDYGIPGNIINYGTVEAPAYNISQVKTPVILMHSKNDAFLDEMSVAELKKSLKSIIHDYTVPDPTFKHMDYMYGSNVKKVITDEVLFLLSKYQRLWQN